jgi:hypothetical protein
MLRNGKYNLVDAAKKRTNFLACESVSVHNGGVVGRCDGAMDDSFRFVERASVLDI